jgi:hypothetical protein
MAKNSSTFMPNTIGWLAEPPNSVRENAASAVLPIQTLPLKGSASPPPVHSPMNTRPPRPQSVHSSMNTPEPLLKVFTDQ